MFGVLSVLCELLWTFISNRNRDLKVFLSLGMIHGFFDAKIIESTNPFQPISADFCPFLPIPAHSSPFHIKYKFATLTGILLFWRHKTHTRHWPSLPIVHTCHYCLSLFLSLEHRQSCCSASHCAPAICNLKATFPWFVMFSHEIGLGKLKV